MIKSTRKLTRFKYAATLVGALAVVALPPATAHALPVNNNEGGGCTYTDNDGYDVPIDEGQDVFVDGKIVSCRGGTIVVTTAPASAGGSTKPSNLPPTVNIGNLPPRRGNTLNASSDQRRSQGVGVVGARMPVG
jgi:hypothetical protein